MDTTELQAIVEWVADADPRTLDAEIAPVEVCYFCGSEIWRKDEHADGCVWLRARTAVGKS